MADEAGRARRVEVFLDRIHLIQNLKSESIASSLGLKGKEYFGRWKVVSHFIYEDLWETDPVYRNLEH